MAGGSLYDTTLGWVDFMGLPFAVSTVTATATVASPNAVVLANAIGTGFSVFTGAAFAGQQITVKKTDATTNAVTVTATSGLIDGAATFILNTQYASLTLVSDGTNWFVI